jgi:chromosome segregation ATPase
LIVIKKQASEQQSHDAQIIGNYSNEWVTTTRKLDDQTQVAAEYEKELATQKKAFAELTNNFSRVSANLNEVSANLTTTESSLKASQEDVAKRDARIADLENKNHALDQQTAELGTAITNLTLQIAETKKQLAASEGNRTYLESQLQRLLSEKAELERQFNDLKVVRARLHKLREEMYLARRMDWMRRGLLANTELKGAQRLMQGAAAVRHPASGPPTNYDLNVELNSQGGARILPPATNTSANVNPQAK